MSTPTRRRALGVVLTLWLGLCCLDRPAFWGKYTESRRAEISREMFEETGNWLVPSLLGERILTKPPGLYWLQALSFRTTGRVDDAAARLPGAILALVALGCVALAGRRWRDEETGWATAGILLTSYLFLNNVRSAEIDMAFCALITIEYSLLVLGFSSRNTRGGRWAFTAFWAVAGVAFMIKGPLALAFPLLGLAAAWIVLRRDPTIQRLGPVFLNPGPILFLLIALPWYLVLVWKLPDAFSVFTRETVGRLGSHTRHIRGPFYYFENLTALAPWVLFLPPVLVTWWKRREWVPSVLLGTVIGGFLLLTLLRSKKDIYLLPLISAWALPAAAWLSELSRNENVQPRSARFARVSLAVLGCIVTVAAIGSGLFVIWQTRRWGAGVAALLFATVAISAAWGPVCGLRGRAVPILRNVELLILSLLSVAILGLHWLLPTLDPEHSVREFAHEISRRVPRESVVVAYGIENYALSFYARRIIRGPVSETELTKRDGWVIVPSSLLPRVRELGTCEVVIRKRDLSPERHLKSSYDLVLIRFHPRTSGGNAKTTSD